MEYIRYKNKGSGVVFITRTILRYDSTCSGLQHLSALIKDTNLAKYVYLTAASPEDKPADLYRIIADRCKEYIVSHKSELTPHWESLVKCGIDRELFKKAVMTKVYNATYITTHNYILGGFKMLSERKYERNGVVLDEATIAIISKYVYDSTNEGNVLQTLDSFMKYLKQWGAVSSKLDTPLL